MQKKRTIVFPSSRAQITIFIILGIVIFAVALFMISLFQDVQKKEIAGEKEKIFSKLASKEPWRLYIDDCLTDELAKGLVLIGQQGGLWKGQPGGIFDFSSTSGVSYLNTQLAYGITNKQHLPSNQYPCQKGLPEEFCEYQYPNSSFSPSHGVKFGVPKLSQRAIEGMLGDYLKNKTIKCISDFVQNNYSVYVTVNIDKMDLTLDVLDEGIKIAAEVPLQVGTRESFTQSSEFDLFYPTYFKRFLDTSISRPLGFDTSYLDFNYTSSNLKQNKFKHGCFKEGKITECTKSLNQPVGFTVKTAIKKDALPTGDDIYRFVASGILKNQDYIFQFARQNRPPALDYVSRYSCLKEGYDYLVIPQGKDKEDQLINISLSAIDPDEENVTYEFKSSLVPAKFDAAGEAYATNRFVVDSKSISPNWYNISAVAKDDFGKQDNQTVRVLIDRPIKVHINVTLPYDINNEISKGVFVISKEDPFFVKVDLPQKSLIAKKPEIVLSYKSLSNSLDGFQYKYEQPGLQPCFAFPGINQISNCLLSSYNLDKWQVKLKSPFYNMTKARGKLKVDYGITYCDKNTQESAAEVTLNVVQCIPYQNKLHPYPYIEDTEYYKTKLGDKDPTTGKHSKSKEDINTFLANHSCCEGPLDNPGLWAPKKKGTVCYEQETGESCLSNSPFLTKIKLIGKCDGLRGNVCGELKKIPVKTTGPQKCGDPDKGCAVDKACKDQEPYSYSKDAWCNEGLGCRSTCTTEIVATAGIANTVKLQGFSPTLVKSKHQQFKCGCSKKIGGKYVYIDLPCWNLDKMRTGQCKEAKKGWGSKPSCVTP